MREKLGNGVDVWGDPTDVWVAARRVWNQNAYHVTNVTESGTLPNHEPESWKPYNGRLYAVPGVRDSVTRPHWFAAPRLFWKTERRAQE